MQNRISKILSQLMRDQGINQAELSRRTGVGQSTISRILKPDGPKGIKNPTDTQVKPIADFFNISTDQLRGHLSLEKRPAKTASTGADEAQIIGGLSGWDSDTPLDDDEVYVPLYKEVELAAGSGSTAVQEIEGRKIRFALSTLREAGVDPSNAIAAQARGNSMERIILDGATIGIDRGTKQVIDGEIYAIDHDGMLRVKYLYRLPGGGLRLRSENQEEHPDEVLDAEQAKLVSIIGWVFWWSTVRRRRGVSLAKAP